MPTPTEEEVEDVLLSCRYGELEEVKGFVEQYGWDALASARDDRGNTALHMCCGNGHAGRPSISSMNMPSPEPHLDLLNFILPYSPASLLSETNSAKSPPIHWAVLNNHVPIVKTLAEYPEHKGGGLQLFKVCLFYASPWLS
jgi:hypothetical protein